MGNVLEVEKLTIRVKNGGRILVRDVSFSIGEKERVAIVGESGSGKTMTSMAVMGLLPSGVEKISGTIRINGLDTDTWTAEQWRCMRNTGIAMVLQNPMSAFDPVHTIRFHFLETLSAHGLPSRGALVDEKAIPALRESGFDDPQPILDLYPFQMSGGMLQRVMIALALISSPRLLIADEATTDLDVISQAQILKLIDERCQERGMALLTIAHDLSVAAALAKNVLVMRHGAVVEYGALDRLYTCPQSEYTAGLLKAHHDLYSPRFVRFMQCMENIPAPQA